MELQHLIAKIYVANDLKLNPALVVNVFHRWVAAQSMPEMLVDVAELLHVPAGPGVIAVGHEADYALDRTGGRWGVLYRRKTILPGTNAERVTQALRAAASAAVLLEAEFRTELAFSRREFELIVNDRALAPNRPETFTAAQADLEAGVKEFLGHADFKLAPQDGDRRRRFAVSVRTAQPLVLPVVEV
jgi:hypothetical protein